MMNASRGPAGGPMPEIREVKVRRSLLQLNPHSGNWFERSTNELWVGPFLSDAWTSQHITINFDVIYPPGTGLRQFKIKFELDPDHEINDPLRSNNTAFSPVFYHHQSD
jgi:hypothetical protein